MKKIILLTSVFVVFTLAACAIKTNKTPSPTTPTQGLVLPATTPEQAKNLPETVITPPEPQTVFIRIMEFDEYKHGLDADTKAYLATKVADFKKLDYNKIIITGHTDNFGTRAQNKKISLDRAKEVAQYFIANGIPKDKVEYYGMADERPIASNDTEEGRKSNRRVEITLK
ncbi:MAG: OmpA family protein [Elusimicrobiota bacterium]|jgi:outer membrane protein OmpA-like peptidoglycan-associated protein|nr:OmpA family protein [Elusimicrobiota bacterium]